MTVYVLSTMTNSVSYRTYRMVGSTQEKGHGPLPVPEPNAVIIYGGAGLPSHRSGFGEVSEDLQGQPLWTPAGVVTPVSDENYEKLANHWLFKKHLEKNLVKVLKDDIRGNHKEVARQVAMDMQPHDNFAQLTKETLAQRIKVKVPSKELSQDGSDFVRL